MKQVLPRLDRPQTPFLVFEPRMLSKLVSAISFKMALFSITGVFASSSTC